ncbi:MAG: helix-turn-helix domain-containing protein [Planctomycetota bacterium]
MIRVLSTSEFAKALGVSESSVRRLADSGDLDIHRTRGGHRRIPVPDAVRYVRETGAKLLRPELLGLAEVPEAVDVATAKQQMLTVFREGHAASVISLVQSLYASGMSIAELCDGPISHAMASIGETWPHDQRAIFIEHRAVVLCARALTQLHGSLGDPDPDAPDAIGGAMSGDPYLLPTLMASLVVHGLGFNDINLGPNIPLDVLADSVIDEKPKLLWLAVSEPIRSKTRIRELLHLARTARDENTEFIIGGRHAPSPDEHTIDGGAAWTRCDSMQSFDLKASEILASHLS